MSTVAPATVAPATEEEEEEEEFKPLSAEEMAKVLVETAARVSEAKKKVVASRLKLFLDKPFFSTLAMGLKYVPTTHIESWAVTPNKIVFFNPAIVLEESLMENMMSMIHEILHIIRGDVFINSYFDKEGESHALANIAFDLKVHWVMTSSDYTLPDNGKWAFADPKTAEWKYIGKDKKPRSLKHVDKRGWLDLYEELKKNAGKNEGDDGNIPGGGVDDHSTWGTMPDGSKMPDAVKTKIAKAFNQQVAAAAASARSRGTLPLGLEGLIDEALTPKLDYRSLLRQFIANNMPYDYSFARRDRRFIAHGLCLPGTDKECLEGVVHLDSSGSVWKMRHEFVAEFKGMLEAFHNVKLTLVVCDAAIHYVGEFTSSDISQLKVGGAGGTSHKPVVDWINENMPQARIFISLTDGESDIQSCYHDLPYGMAKFILLDEGTHMDSLSEYGQTVCINQ